jgi:hypothetical protein
MVIVNRREIVRYADYISDANDHHGGQVLPRVFAQEMFLVPLFAESFDEKIGGSRRRWHEPDSRTTPACLSTTTTEYPYDLPRLMVKDLSGDFNQHFPDDTSEKMVI